VLAKTLLRPPRGEEDNARLFIEQFL